MAPTTYKTTRPIDKSKSNSFGLISLAALLLLLSTIFLMNFRFFVTEGSSMEPTYTEGTYLLAVKLHNAPKPGEVVFLKYKNIYCMKRVAFIAGDDVSLSGYEGYWGSNIIPEGYVYVLGDNPDHSADSRNPDFGLVAIFDIWGKPLTQRESQNTTTLED